MEHAAQERRRLWGGLLEPRWQVRMAEVALRRAGAARGPRGAGRMRDIDICAELRWRRPFSAGTVVSECFRRQS